MSSFLETYRSGLLSGQLRAVLDVVDGLRKDGTISGDQELKDVLSQFSASLADKLRFSAATAIRLDRIRSDDLNKSFEDIFIDLSGLYSYVGSLANTVEQHQVALSSAVTRANAGVRKLTQDVLQFLFLRDNPEYSEVKYIDFADARNLTDSRLAAVVDDRSRKLRLPDIRADRHSEAKGSGATTLTTEVLTSGVEVVSSKTFRPQDALDRDDRTFWAEVIHSDVPVTTTYQDATGTDVTVDGVVVKATLLFDRPQFVNSFQLLPFGPYPLEVLDIRFDGIQWNGYSAKSASYEWLGFMGSRKVVQQIDVYLRQRNHQFVDYLLPDWAYRNAVIWDELIDEGLESRYAAEQTFGYENRSTVALPGTAILTRIRNEVTARLGDLSSSVDDPVARSSRIVQVLVDVLGIDGANFKTMTTATDRQDSYVRDGFVEVQRVEYVLGSATISAADVEFATFADYESPKFSISANPLVVELGAEETHYGESRKTSVEYGILLGESLLVPIVPYGDTTITKEYLLLEPATKVARLRFAASGNAAVYRDGTLLGVFVPVSGRYLTITDATIYPDAVYTADYTPVAGQDSIDLQALGASSMRRDILSATDSYGMLELPYYPHIIYDIVNDLTRWRKDPLHASWFIDPAAGVLTYDGTDFGLVQSTVAVEISATDTELDLVSGSGFPQKGVVQVENELIRYKGRTGNKLEGLTRGHGGGRTGTHGGAALHTDAARHLATVAVRLTSNSFYEPMRVIVDGRTARNITDYYSGEHPAFSASDATGSDYQFVHVGRRLYFNKAMSKSTIEVNYRFLFEYLSAGIRLWNHQLGSASLTPTVDRYSLRIKSEPR